MQTSSYKLPLVPAACLLKIAVLLAWLYEQPRGTSGVSTTFMAGVISASSRDADTAAQHSLCVAWR